MKESEKAALGITVGLIIGILLIIVFIQYNQSNENKIKKSYENGYLDGYVKGKEDGKKEVINLVHSNVNSSLKKELIKPKIETLETVATRIINNLPEVKEYRTICKNPIILITESSEKDEIDISVAEDAGDHVVRYMTYIYNSNGKLYKTNAITELTEVKY